MLVTHRRQLACQGDEKGSLAGAGQKEGQAWEVSESLPVDPGGSIRAVRHRASRGRCRREPGAHPFPKDEKNGDPVNAGEILIGPAEGA